MIVHFSLENPLEYRKMIAEYRSTNLLNSKSLYPSRTSGFGRQLPLKERRVGFGFQKLLGLFKSWLYLTNKDLFGDTAFEFAFLQKLLNV